MSEKLSELTKDRPIIPLKIADKECCGGNCCKDEEE